MEDVNNAPLSTEPVVKDTTPVVESTPLVQPGDKTPPNLLLQSLQEEREERRKLEARLSLLETSSESSDVFSDEGKALQGEIKTLRTSLDELKHDNAKKDILIANPIMKDKWAEFETFRSDPENQGMNLRTATKAFLLDQGLLDPERKGLEKTTGGSRIPTNQGISNEDKKLLRETNFRKYTEMLERGEI